MTYLRYIIVLFAVWQTNAQRSDFNHIDFKKADSIALSYSNETLHNLPDLTSKLTANLETEVEQFRAIYFWVCHNISNDYSWYLKNKRKRERFKDDLDQLNSWNEQSRSRILKNMLNKKRTICTGYAYLVKKLATLANIECEIVDGFGRTSMIDVDKLTTPNHSWNAVKIDNKWYLCDPTWASGIPNPETQKFMFYYNDGFYLANPKLFAINHFPADEKWLLMDQNAPTFKDFIDAPVVYGKAYTNLNGHEAPKKMHHDVRKYETITFKYELAKSVEADDITFEIDDGYRNKKIHPKTTHQEDSSLTVQYQFDTTGFYDVHLFIGEDRISTYTFNVKG
ncbi:transglutaminase domain-containing protein [Psychroserpens sp.]|uniref:transglutaminase domain-containing protein n=1 Tax=Psychroserpens sp. TaxID=2020870 RepID=UPI001B1DF300|nr:transglutaminase domain-containing protein [Psychroserpens sp.]MBO6605763.1 hypothetical protein [Psychroserpens sp.]MBO6652866.1 hypothetical protein [Psychroserpens sp.]MBO6681362.1 hypothetical protein [Psychroserpens sp.]MBO6749137.1 hypothetical protein [Psychroserpens sp.]MBO6914417.1 hypothetical protein [Psychroserpens sp.]